MESLIVKLGKFEVTLIVSAGKLQQEWKPHAPKPDELGRYGRVLIQAQRELLKTWAKTSGNAPGVF